MLLIAVSIIKVRYLIKSLDLEYENQPINDSSV